MTLTDGATINHCALRKPASSELVQLIYASSATERFQESDLESILTLSRRQNTANSITGLLVYCDGNFLQVLEGPKAAVEKAFARILTDPRHRGCQVLFSKPVAERDFPEWSMGFRKSSRLELSQGSGYANFFGQDLTTGIQGRAARVLLNNFRRIHRGI